MNLFSNPVLVTGGVLVVKIKQLVPLSHGNKKPASVLAGFLRLPQAS